MLESDGEIWVSVPNRHRIEKDIDPEPFDMPPHHLTSWTLDSIILLGRRVGLEVVDVWVSKTRPTNFLAKVFFKYMRKKYTKIDSSEIRLNQSEKFGGYQFLVRYKN